MAHHELHSAIVAYLTEFGASAGLSEDDAESLLVATQCLKQAFQVPDTPAALPHGATLPQVFAAGLASLSSASSSAAPSSAAPSAEDKARAEAIKTTGNNKMKDRDYAGAIECYTKAIEIDPSNALYYANRAAALTSTQKWEEAIADCDRSASLDPKYVKAFTRKGTVLMQLERFSEAAAAFKKALELDPSNDRIAQDLRQAEEKASGNAPAAAAAPSGMPDLAGMLNNPGMMGMMNQFMQSGQLQSTLANPAFRQMAGSFLSSMGMGGDVESLLENPEAIASMLGGAGGDQQQQ